MEQYLLVPLLIQRLSILPQGEEKSSQDSPGTKTKGAFSTKLGAAATTGGEPAAPAPAGAPAPGPACAGAVRPRGPYGCGAGRRAAFPGSKNTLTALINQYINAAASAIVVSSPASARAGPRRINQNVDIEAQNVDISICF